jgi:hypothetical protein
MAFIKRPAPLARVALVNKISPTCAAVITVVVPTVVTKNVNIFFLLSFCLQPHYKTPFSETVKMISKGLL